MKPDDSKEILPAAARIVDQFVRDGSDMQINISQQERNKILVNAAEPTTAPTAFVTAERECQKLVIQGGYIDNFFKSAIRTISPTEIKNRYIIAAVSISIAIIIWLCLWLLSDLSRWIRLVVFLPYFIGFSYLTSASEGA